MATKKAAPPKRRPTTNALRLAMEAKDSAAVAYLAACEIVEIMRAEDARTGKPDPHLRRRRRSPGASA